MGFRVEEFESSSQGGCSSIGSGPSGGNLLGEMPFASFLLGGILSLASVCGIQGRGSIEGQQPAEPDDPNSSTLNPKRLKKSGVGKLAFRIDRQTRALLY